MTVCPKCGGANSTPPTPHEWEVSDAYGLPAPAGHPCPRCALSVVMADLLAAYGRSALLRVIAETCEPGEFGAFCVDAGVLERPEHPDSSIPRATARLLDGEHLVWSQRRPTASRVTLYREVALPKENP